MLSIAGLFISLPLSSGYFRRWATAWRGADGGASTVVLSHGSRAAHGPAAMQRHGTCVARDGAGVLLTGEAGSGKSDLALRLLSRGFILVADDQVLIDGAFARPPSALAGLLEIRGLGILRVPFAIEARLVLIVSLGAGVARLPTPERDRSLGLPLVRLDPSRLSAPEIVACALDCALGIVTQVAGAFVS